MTNEPARIEQLFNAALQRANHIERHVFLSGACGNDTALWNEVWDRLRSRPETRGRSHKSRVIKVSKSPPHAAAPEKPGDMLGPYRLLQITHENTCGVRWIAERNQSVAEFVAIKVVAAAPANDFLIRYEAQKHALALLDHPSIAKPQACGMTPGGNPYLVTELIHGEPITQFCDDQKLPLLLRVRLFLQVCDAIQHAHQKGVVHGDLKPSNLLVMWGDDGQPLLKITDFGIVKALNHTLVTPSGWLRTPAAYLSPEHVGTGGIDARSDIYALGMLLYELLTGRLPFATPRETAEHLEDIKRLVCEAPKPKPSDCLRTLPKAQLTGIALSRQVENAQIVALMEEHFDGIVMRALEKNPLERYTTASALANDFQRYLTEAAAMEEPPRMQGSTVGNFVSEHRSLFALAAVLVLTLTVGMMCAGWLLLQRKQDETRVAAKKKLESHSMTAQFLQEMFGALTPEKVKGHDTTLLKNMLDEAAEHLDTLAENPEAGARTQETIGLTYLALSQPVDAQKQLQGALDKRKLALGGEHRDTLRSMKDLATTLKEQGRYADAEGMLRHTLNAQQRALGPEHLDTFVTITVLAAVCDAQEKHLEAETLFLNLWQVQKRVLGPDHLETLATLSNLATSYTGQGRFAEAMKLRGEHLEAMQRVQGKRGPQTLVSMTINAEACEAGGMPSEAEKLYFGALEIMKQTLGMEHPDTLAQLDRTALVLGRRGRHEEALKLHRQSLAAKQQVFGVQHPQTLLSMKCVADEYEAQGNRAEAETSQLQVLEILKAAFPPEHPEILFQMDNVADVYDHHDKHAAAVALRQHTLEVRQRTLGSSHPQTLHSMQMLAKAYDADGKPAEAETLQLQTLDAMKTAYGAGDPDVLAQMRVVALMHDRHGKHAEAESMYLQMLQIQQRALGIEHADTLGTMTGLAGTYHQQGKVEEAEKVYQQVLEIQRKHSTADPAALADAAANLGCFWLQAGKFAEAEVVLRESLELRITHSADHWLRFSAESMLGGALLGKQAFAEAGTLLRSGYAGLNERMSTIPEDARHYLREALERLAQYTEITGGVAQAAAWKQQLAAFDQPRQGGGQ
ncbi:MAG: tetratricopeptide repeat protein [Prosthecobacter sp.]|uniref:tetratricopeptide repeat protein n=1 Tax=Prosthecobacter sp. TaxID=1965333 RepID=UPI00390368C4